MREQQPERPRSRMTVRVDVLLDGNFYRAVPVTFLVSAITPVLVARADLAKGMMPACANLELQLRDIAAFPSAPQTGDCADLQRRLRRNLTAGDVLLSSELETIPAVSEGQYVTLQVSEGAVQLESRALALADGRVGQRIAVRATASQEPVLATVIAPGLVNLSGN